MRRLCLYDSWMNDNLSTSSFFIMAIWRLNCCKQVFSDAALWTFRGIWRFCDADWGCRDSLWWTTMKIGTVGVKTTKRTSGVFKSVAAQTGADCRSLIPLNQGYGIESIRWENDEPAYKELFVNCFGFPNRYLPFMFMIQPLLVLSSLF